jgi:F-type H+-transporting ATPase subunit gamma
MMQSLTANLTVDGDAPKLLAGTGKQDTVLLIVITSDRGLCGAFNSSIVRETRRQITLLEGQCKDVKLLCVGRKGRDLLRREHFRKIVDSFEDLGRKKLTYDDAQKVVNRVMELYEHHSFDVAHIIYNRFKNVLVQVVTQQQLIPVPLPEKKADAAMVEAKAQYEFEPDETTILADLLPRNLGVQIYRAMLESAAGEQGARMNAMDNATRNAGEMINKLSLQYNRARQAYITKEMIEIVTGAATV